MAVFQELWNKYIWGATSKSVGSSYDLKGTDALQRLIGHYDNFSEEAVSERRALQLATVYSCVNVRSQTLAILPADVVKDKNGKKEKLDDHPVHYLTSKQASNYMSAANLFLTSMIHSDCWGNSLIFIHGNSLTLEPEALEHIMPDQWSVSKANGQAFYTINGETYSSRDVLHFRWFSLDGLMGVSPIRQNAMTLGKAIKTERYSALSMGMKPPGFLSYEGNLLPEQKAQNQKQWKENMKNGDTPVLSGRWDYKHIMISPDELQYIETERLTEQKICGIFRVPPTFIQDFTRATWSNAEQSDLIFAKHTVTPICRMIEQECNMKLFTEKEKKTTYLKFNMNGLLRGDSAARASLYREMVGNGLMNRDEVRDLEDRNPIPDGYGQMFTVQAGFAPIDQLKNIYEKDVLPTAEESIKKELKDIKLNGHKVLN